VEALEACHRARGFNGIGYHYYITKDGQLHLTRSEEVQGAHAKRYNKNSIGICYEGGLDEKGKPADTRTPAQKRTLLALLKSLRVDFPDAEILGHRDLPWVKKACPGFDVRTEYQGI
jgi:N-acetyl-anhydromuramyl-L-alanine amidase AmpD